MAQVTPLSGVMAPDYGIPDDDDLEIVGMVGRTFEHFTGSYHEFTIQHEQGSKLVVLYANGEEDTFLRQTFIRAWREGMFREL